MKKILTALFVLATTQMVMAASTPINKIKHIYVYEDYIIMKMESKHGNEYGCTHAQSNEFLYLKTDTSGGNRMYSALLSAYVAGKKIKVGYSLCGQWGDKTVPKAYGITIVK
jgi:hypothetical protein